MTGPIINPIPQGRHGQSGEGGRCPECGSQAESRFDAYNIIYKCQTVIREGVVFLSEPCAKRQISQLKERLEAWRKWYVALRIGGHERLDEAKKHLKELGEI